MKISITTYSPDGTSLVGKTLARFLTPGDMIPLIGEMGSGKTCFVQGVARGLGVPDSTPVNSPSFTLVNRYSGNHILYHMDLFRLNSENELADLEVDELIHGDGIAIIEWPQLLASDISDASLSIEFVWDMTEETKREIKFRSDLDRFQSFFKELKHADSWR